MKVIIITGASSGIGYALAEALIARDQYIVAIARREQPLQDLKNKYPDQVRIISADVSSVKGRENIVNNLADIKQITALVHNAGVIEPVAPIQKIELQQWRRAQAVNTEAPLFLSQALIPKLKQGRILHISTAAAHIPFPAWSAYCSSKAALFMLYQCLKLELADIPIAVGSVMPGIVDTAMQAEIRAHKNMPKERLDFFTELKANHKLLSTQTVARFLSWLLLDVKSDEFSEQEWDIYDTSHHDAWLEGEVLPEIS